MPPDPNYPKQFWREAYALGSMTEAIQTLEKIQFVLDNNYLFLYDPLWVSFAIAYCRPFTDNNDIGQISDRLVPQEFRELHKAIWNSRNKMIGHTDPAERADNGIQVNRLKIRVSGGNIFPYPGRLTPCPTQIPRFLDLANAICTEIGSRAAMHLSKLDGISNLADGDYVYDYTLPRHEQWTPHTNP